jgi:hypothetical protein
MRSYQRLNHFIAAWCILDAGVFAAAAALQGAGWLAVVGFLLALAYLYDRNAFSS